MRPRRAKPGPTFRAPTVERHRLSRRQAQVVALVAQGLTDKEVAAELGLSEHTIGRHMHVIFTKIAVHSRTALAAWSFMPTASPGGQRKA